MAKKKTVKEITDAKIIEFMEKHKVFVHAGSIAWSALHKDHSYTTRGMNLRNAVRHAMQDEARMLAKMKKELEKEYGK